jgi:hypothetical protein
MRMAMLQFNCKGAHDYAFKILVNAALREREDEAWPVTMEKLQQMFDTKAWHAV